MGGQTAVKMLQGTALQVLRYYKIPDVVIHEYGPL